MLKKIQELQQRVLTVNEATFTELALDIFRFQAQHNNVYAQYLAALRISWQEVQSLSDIPYLPIRFFKSHTVQSGNWPAAQVFESSSTTGTGISRHHFPETSFYNQLAVAGYRQLVGNLENTAVFALLPNYLERANSSLVSMAEHFIKQSQAPYGGFFLYDTESLTQQVNAARQAGYAVLLLGVSFALLDFAEQQPVTWPEVLVMETGGMKGRRQEITRAELHARLAAGFGVEAVASEYGMTELTSQAYARQAGVFSCPPWMRVRVREINDPFTFLPPGRTGGLNVIDLGNVHSCSFIETEDLAIMEPQGTFRVLGRYDMAEARGCNLMVANL